MPFTPRTMPEIITEETEMEGYDHAAMAAGAAAGLVLATVGMDDFGTLRLIELRCRNAMMYGWKSQFYYTWRDREWRRVHPGQLP